SDGLTKLEPRDPVRVLGRSSRLVHRLLGALHARQAVGQSRGSRRSPAPDGAVKHDDGADNWARQGLSEVGQTAQNAGLTQVTKQAVLRSKSLGMYKNLYIGVLPLLRVDSG